MCGGNRGKTSRGFTTAINQLRAEWEAGKAGRQQSGSGGKEPTYLGPPLANHLRNPVTAGTNDWTLRQLLTLRQVATGEEPDLATFELPIRYNLLTNIGSLRLLVDSVLSLPREVSNNPSPDEFVTAPEAGQYQDCKGATNADCLLVWNGLLLAEISAETRHRRNQ